jgi:hypothetical protein
MNAKFNLLFTWWSNTYRSQTWRIDLMLRSSSFSESPVFIGKKLSESVTVID